MAAASDGRPSRRRKALLALAGVIALAGAGWAGYEWLVARHYESTDNAYVQGHIVQVTPQIGGTVTAVHAEDTDAVRAGQLLVQLDPADAKVALEQAEATLGQAVRQVRTLYANNAALAAQVRLREAEIAKAQAELARAEDDVARRRSLASSGAISREELHHATTQAANARSALAAAQAGAAAAREQLASNRAMTDGTSVQDHPAVRAAAAKVREAWLATQRTVLRAPVDGHVAKRAVQLGQRVAAGTPLMAVIPLRRVWVDANFKESQLRRIRVGQRVKLTADLYGKRIEYHGIVAGLGAGTGSAFALLPAQNATGNWIKVVQRVPVRVELDPRELAANQLRVGLSMVAEVDVDSPPGPALAEAPRTAPLTQQQVEPALAGADAAVRRVISANLPAGARAPRTAVRAPARAASAAH